MACTTRARVCSSTFEWPLDTRDMAAGLAACRSSSSPAASTASTAGSSPAAGGTGASAIAAALQQPTTLTVWAWAPQTADIVKAFEKQYPKVTVHLVNAGTGSAEYAKL